ncbi:MAG: hypothetical protein QOD70_861 [Frankiales bacterium]|jgi:hypothetical protein|nr:hypothetical protein [Frankiales bacterium]
MPGVGVLVGTRKGAFVLTSDEGRRRWEVEGPHFGGWEVYHLKGSPVDPDRIWASQSTAWFGQLVQRSDDGGRSWDPVGKDFSYASVPGTTSGTTGRRPRGSSRGCGTSSRATWTRRRVR